ncbi:MAG: FAD:protein FMN transferase, partial [Candidatus Omnitrophica bacterium]|nr:FAD:protein FMN transferase [Candidatus Omnitrophota bacterium]
WGFSSKEFKKPSQERIDEVRAQVGWRKIALSDEGEQRCMIQFSQPGVQIDLGGIAKGYICDRVSDLFIAAEVENFLVNIGGTIFAHGRSKRSRHWVAGIRDPRDRSRVIEHITLFNEAIATSGDYERYFVEDNKRYAHIIDPVTGYPVEGTVAVTVVAATAIAADAASTIMFLTPPAERHDMLKPLQLKKAIIHEEESIGKMRRIDIG